MSTGVTTATQSHFPHMDYTICIRRESGKTIMCYYPISGASGAIGTAAIAQGTFGLSVSAKATKAEAHANSNCAADYLEFAGLETKTDGVPTIKAVFRTCGRTFG